MRHSTLLLILAVLAGCSTDDGTTRLSGMNYDSNLFSGNKPESGVKFHYDGEGRVVSIRSFSINSTDDDETLISYSENLVEAQQATTVKAISLENGLLKQYTIKYPYMDDFLYDTLNFTYTDGRLSQVFHAGSNENFLVEADVAGNITRFVSDNHDYKFEYDNKPNPLKGIMTSNFSVIFSETQSIIAARNIAVYLSPNNNGYPFDGNAKYTYSANGYPKKIDSRNLYQERVEFVYELIPGE